MKNPVAKHMYKTSRSSVMVDRKKQSKIDPDLESLEDCVLAELAKERLTSGEKCVRAVIDPETGEITFPDEAYGLTDLGCCGIMIAD